MGFGNLYQFVFDVEILDNAPADAIIPVNLTVNSQNVATINRALELGLNRTIVLVDEDFNHGTLTMPAGWNATGSILAWSVVNSANAGGIAPELRFASGTGSSTSLSTPPIDAAEVHKAQISFRFRATIGGTGNIPFTVHSRIGLTGTTTPIWSRTLTPGTVEDVVTAYITPAHLGQEGLYLSFSLSGALSNVTGLYIDDVVIRAVNENTAILSGSVSIENFDRSQSEVKIQVGRFTTEVRGNAYALYLVPGRYPSIHVIHPFIDVTPFGDTTFDPGRQVVRNFNNMRYRAQPKYLVAEVDTIAHRVELKWEHEFTGLTLRNFHVYRQTNSMEYERIYTTQNKSMPQQQLNSDFRYRYYVVAEFMSGMSDRSNVVFVDPNVSTPPDTNYVFDNITQPLTFNLSPNFPNPFNPSTNIMFTIPEPSNVSVRIYNIRGQLVRNLRNEFMDRGAHTVVWNGDNDSGRAVGSGVYFIRVQDDQNSAIRRALLLK
jgi:hypothetical protein